MNAAMTLDSLITEFNNLKTSIAEAAQKDDGELLRSLDSDIQELFDTILAYTPSSNEQRKLHCEFLLESLLPSESRQGASQLICEKILQIISET